MFTQKACVLFVVSVLGVSSSLFGASLPTSYKSTSNITSLGPGTDDCPTGRIPLEVFGYGMDSFGPFKLTEQMCADPLTGVFAGQFKIEHSGEGYYCGPFNGTFFPSGDIFEVHATWRITDGTGKFFHLAGAGTAKGAAAAVNGGPGPGTLLLDGSIVFPAEE